jgi:hypothetical protein
VEPQEFDYQYFMKCLSFEVARMESNSRRRELVETIQEQLDRTRHRIKCVDFDFWRQWIIDIFWFIVFLVVASIAVTVGTMAYFFVAFGRIFFDALIIWRQLQNYFNLLYFQDLIVLVVQAVVSFLGQLQIPDFLLIVFRFLFLECLQKVFEVLALFTIDFSALNVTCEGSKIPFNLLINLLILGAVIITIQSKMQLFRNMVVVPAHSMYIRFLASKLFQSDGVCDFCFWSLRMFWAFIAQIPIYRMKS